MDKNKIVIITVSGGVADVYHQPEGTKVVIVDYDNLEDGGYAYCPFCHTYFEDGLEEGICSVCGFDINNLDKKLE